MNFNPEKMHGWMPIIMVVLMVIIAGMLGYIIRDRVVTDGLKKLSETTQFDSSIRRIQGSQDNPIVRTAAQVRAAVVSIVVTEFREVRHPASEDPLLRYFGGEEIIKHEAASIGSGFIISPDGYILTSGHVIENATKIVVTLTNGEHYPAHIHGASMISDVAVLKIDTVGVPFVKLGNSDNLAVGETVIAFGNPFGLFKMNNQPTVTVGVVSNTHLNFEKPEEHRAYREMIQTDAAINSGNSGGPLVNIYSEAVGINTINFTPTEGNVGIGFAIPINRVKPMLQDLSEHGVLREDFWLGFQCVAVTENLAKIFLLQKVQGVVVTSIEKGSPADQGGLRVNDIILEVNNRPVEHDDSLVKVFVNLKIGDELKLKVMRRHMLIPIALKLRERS